MRQGNKIILAIVILLVFVAVILGVDWLRRPGMLTPPRDGQPLCQQEVFRSTSTVSW